MFAVKVRNVSKPMVLVGTILRRKITIAKMIIRQEQMSPSAYRFFIEALPMSSRLKRISACCFTGIRMVKYNSFIYYVCLEMYGYACFPVIGNPACQKTVRSAFSTT
jgi:hypothetical protein